MSLSFDVDLTADRYGWINCCHYVNPINSSCHYLSVSSLAQLLGAPEDGEIINGQMDIFEKCRKFSEGLWSVFLSYHTLMNKFGLWYFLCAHLHCLLVPVFALCVFMNLSICIYVVVMLWCCNSFEILLNMESLVSLHHCGLIHALHNAFFVLLDLLVKTVICYMIAMHVICLKMKIKSLS